MPGARPRSYRFGDNAELLAEFILNCLAFTTRVPRQEDIGHDFLCSLAERDDLLLRAGPFFTVQVKSNHESIVFEKPYETDWIRKQDNPFFVCVATRNNLTIELFSTWNMHNGFLYRKADRIVLVPGGPNDEFQPPETEKDRSEQRIPLGKPFLRIAAGDVMDEDNVNSYRMIMRDWVELDRENIVNRAAGMYWVAGPTSYATNERLAKNLVVPYAFYWNIDNLPKSLKNFGRSAIALRTVLRCALSVEEKSHPDWNQKVDDLERVLGSFSEDLEPAAKKILFNGVDIEL